MTAIVEKAGLDALLAALWQRGYTVIGPTVRSRSIVYDEVRRADDLPAGWVDVQEGRHGLAPRSLAFYLSGECGSRTRLIEDRAAAVSEGWAA
jgi:hypothetical protein